MKTTLDLPEDLLAEAMEITGNNKNQTIVKALEGLIRKDKISRIMDQRKVDPNIDDEDPNPRGSSSP